MNTRIDEVAAGIYKIGTYSSTSGIVFSQYLIDADEPLLFHCGQRSLFADVSAAVTRVMPLEKLRWISYSHVEADECGPSMIGSPLRRGRRRCRAAWVVRSG